MIPQPRTPMDLDVDEQVVLSMRRHPIVLVWALLPPLLILFVPLLLIATSAFVSQGNDAVAASTRQVSSTVLALLIIPLSLWVAYLLYDYANDSFHVTTKRVIRSQQNFIWSQEIIEARLAQIQNVGVKKPHLLANIFNYGNVSIETAAYVGTVLFDSVANPRSIQRTIFRLRGVEPPPEPAPPQRRWPGMGHFLLALMPLRPIVTPSGAVVYHKHWFALIKVILWPLLLILLVLALAQIFDAPILLWSLVVLVPAFAFQYANWINDIYILTDQRIIDVYRIPLIREDRREALLQNIQNVSVTLPTLISRLLDFGDVFVETAGKTDNFLFKSVPHPRRVREELNRRLDQVRINQQRTLEETRRKETEAMIRQILQEQYGSRPPVEVGARRTTVRGASSNASQRKYRRCLAKKQANACRRERRTSVVALNLILGFILSVVIAAVAYRAHSLSTSGAVGAIIEGTLIFGLGGWAWGLLLIAFFVSSSALSHYRAARKAGLAEKFAKTGQRDAAQVLANGGLGAALAVLSLVSTDSWSLFAAFVGAMAAVNADTWATELGVLNSRPPRLITNGQVVTVGTSGAVSRLGLAAAAAGALFIGVATVIFSPLQGSLPLERIGSLIVIALLAGLGGSLVDSLMGATVQGIYWCGHCQKETEKRIHTCGEHTRLLRGWAWLDNEWVNFICSAIGALLAWAMWVA